MKDKEKVLSSGICECGLPGLRLHGLAEHAALMRDQVAQSLAIPGEDPLHAKAA